MNIDKYSSEAKLGVSIAMNEGEGEGALQLDKSITLIDSPS